MSSFKKGLQPKVGKVSSGEGGPGDPGPEKEPKPAHGF